MENSLNIRVRTATQLSVALIVWVDATVEARAQNQDQWQRVEKQLIDYVADGYAIETILLDRLTPLATQATLFYLRKENILVRCSETITRKGVTLLSATVSCAELGKPVAK
jgi:hypothetical protein